MNGWLIYTKNDSIRNKSYIDWFIDEAKKQSIHLTLLLRENISIGIHKNKPVIRANGKEISADFAVVRTMDPFLNRQLEQIGITVFNNRIISETFNHKAHAYLAIQQLGIPVPQSYFFPGKINPSPLPLDFPFVVKSAKGKGGKQVAMIYNQKEWEAYRQTLTEDFILQSPRQIQAGKDLRVFIIDKKIIAAVLRINTNDFRANYSLGGTASLYTLNKTEKSTIQRIIDAYEFGLAGIDFMFTDDGQLIFNEIEDAVGSRTLSMLSDINILKEYIRFIKEKMQ
ncbi:RimK family alpha-L-glutamate ligase [Oceanobacillus sp. CFH 90083]|uniref:ATP-grasp domain-containing protein n=1 Tax=Oceanobacillus sp. CFH 90083 TaxID=2592336 RepID=UPI00128BD515|nr:ATP-grasp domain-containing protein [Oceanobacillus sp. CFH 90083]